MTVVQKLIVKVLDAKTIITIVVTHRSIKPKGKRESVSVTKSSGSGKLSVVPYSVWRVMNTQKSHRHESVFNAKLVHHRLYQHTNSPSSIQN